MGDFTTHIRQILAVVLALAFLTGIGTLFHSSVPENTLSALSIKSTGQTQSQSESASRLGIGDQLAKDAQDPSKSQAQRDASLKALISIGSLNLSIGNTVQDVQALSLQLQKPDLTPEKRQAIYDALASFADFTLSGTGVSPTSGLTSSGYSIPIGGGIITLRVSPSIDSLLGGCCGSLSTQKVIGKSGNNTITKTPTTSIKTDAGASTQKTSGSDVQGKGTAQTGTTVKGSGATDGVDAKTANSNRSQSTQTDSAPVDSKTDKSSGNAGGANSNSGAANSVSNGGTGGLQNGFGGGGY